MDQELTHKQFHTLLEDVTNTLQGLGSEQGELDPETLATILRNTQFFHRNLEAPANLHDFVHLAKDQLSYEVYPYGSVLMKEGDYADRLCLILKGSSQKLQQRPYEELEREIRKRNPKAFKEDAIIHFKSKESSLLKNNPRYLQHTVATKKKTHFTKANNLVVTLNKISSNEANERLVDGKGAKTLNNLEHSGGENMNDRSLNDQEWEDQINQTLENEEELPVPTKSMVFARLKQLHRSNTKKIVVPDSVNFDSGSLEDLGLEEDSGEKSPKKKKSEDDKTLTEDDVMMIRYLAAENPEMKQRLFVGNIPRVEKGRGYKVGECFGENFFKDNRPKETSIMVVTSEELHLLTLSREAYQEIMAKIILNAKEKADFFIEVFPSFDSETVVKFSYYFSEKQFKKNESIYHQDNLAQELYLLKNGDVRLTKEIDLGSEGHPININARRGEKTHLPVASIIRQQFFGEELLLKEGRRLYTAMAISSGSTAYFISLKEYNKIKNGFSELLKVLKQQTKERFGWRQQRVMDLLEQRLQKNNAKKQGMQLPGFEKANNNGEDIVGFQGVHKSPRGLDLTRMLKNNSDGADETMNSGREGYQLINKARSAKHEEQGSKHLELYKAKYSRKTKLVEKALLEEGQIKKRGEETFLLATVPQGDSGPINYNIRKELASVKHHKLKLPLIKSPKTVNMTSGMKDNGGYIKSINSIFREPSLANIERKNNILDKKRQQAKSSVLDHMRFDTLDDHLITDTHESKKKDVKEQLGHLPLRMYGLIKRAEGPKEVDEFGDQHQSHLINFHKVKFPKKVAGGFKMAPRKTSNDCMRAETDHDLTLIAGRRTELPNKYQF